MPGAVVTLIFALIAHRQRAVSLSGAIAGATVSFILYVAAGPGAFVTLGMVFLVTVATTCLGRKRKRALGIAETKYGRNAWQVLANLAVGTALSLAFLYTSRAGMLLAAVAAFGEAAADTASSEIGKAASDRVYLITNFRRVAVGADGAISWIGTAGGMVAAIMVVLVAAACHLVPLHWIAAAAGAAILGNFVDSLLGATLQSYGWLNNSLVNLIGTSMAAAIALALLQN